MLDDRRGDVRDVEMVRSLVEDSQPEVVFHLAAQALVRRSFREPLETYETNVMGTANVLDAVRQSGGVQAVVVVTSDKCYENDELGRPFVESDPLGGYDPYSNSKGAAELVTAAFRRSFFSEPDTANVASARAGNVIGGGDWSEDRLVPDIMRAALAGEQVLVRSPQSVRPWQHVLNPLSGYLVLAEALLASDAAAEAWNFGPDPGDARSVSFLVERIAESWPSPLRWNVDADDHPHEANLLSLDSTKARERLGWQSTWGLETGIEATVKWFEALAGGDDLLSVTLGQVDAFEASPR